MKGFTLSGGIGKIPGVEHFLDLQVLTRNPMALARSDCAAVYSWGSKPYSVYSCQLANRFKLPHVRLEDGFICSFGAGGRHRKYSLVIDRTGIYYDAGAPSRLENILNGTDADSELLNDSAWRGRARSNIAAILESDISKYNISGSAATIAAHDYALVIDQTRGDQSVEYGNMNAGSFEQMLSDAIRDHEHVYVKVHPDVLAGKREGYLAEAAKRCGAKLIAGEISTDQIKRCSTVYVGTSLYGMEALLRGLKVVCYGQPFYAGWGLTQDRVAHARRTVSRSIEELFIAAYMLYPAYVDPVTRNRCELEDIIEHIRLQRQQRARVARAYTCVGITPWKRRYIDRYLMSGEFEHRFVRRNSDLSNHTKPLLFWGKKASNGDSEQGVTGESVARMEDGFVRSVGLGSNFTAPRSLVIDDMGIYFDATTPSRLEHLLQHHDCNGHETARAAALIQKLLENRISKYSVGRVDDSSNNSSEAFYRDNRPLLVVGQVDGDASLRFGTYEVETNLQLLQAVRAAYPDRCIVYKPHPDVVSGNRSDGIVNYRDIARYCDHIETKLSIDCTFSLCDQIHTLTSLAGFEALLWGKQVVTYGMPFYAGWGLTIDNCECTRRNRRRTLAELVYISYVLYPAYLDIGSGEFTSVEKTVDALVLERARMESRVDSGGLIKYANMLRNIRKGLTYAA